LPSLAKSEVIFWKAAALLPAPSVLRVCTASTASSTILRSEEHTSELQSRFDLVCRLLLEKKNLDWLRGIRDWYVSRQLWPGHRSPGWYCPNGHLFTDAGHPVPFRECGSGGLTEHPDGISP